MALLDVSLVTQSLLNLIRGHVTASPVWSGSPTVSPESPDQLSGESNTIGFYLYHISEDEGYKNPPPPGRDVPPIRYTPMGLVLHYQLTAHDHGQDGTIATFNEQRLMGCAIKALRDYPVIDDTTVIGGGIILDSLLRGSDNRLQIVLQPISPEQAIQYWSAGTSPMRLAAYYEVGVALLEPETTSTRAGRVLSYGVYAFNRQTPHLDSSYNVLSFTIPGEANPREIELRPAQVPFDGTVTFTGSSLSGDATTLLLRHPRWNDLVEVDFAWGVQAAFNRVSAVVQDTASGEAILPGTYDALVRVSTQRNVPGGGTRIFEHLSNVCPFSITPRIDNIDPRTPSGDVTLTVTGFIFQHAELDPGDVLVYMGENRLDVGTLLSLNRGEFAIEDSTTLKARLPTGVIGPAGNGLDWTGTAAVITSGMYTAFTLKTYTFTIANAGTPPNTDPTVGTHTIDIDWDSGAGNNGTINLPASYVAETAVAVSEGLEVAFSAGTLVVGQVFTVEVQPAFTPGSMVSLRLFINGAESLPNWIQAP